MRTIVKDNATNFEWPAITVTAILKVDAMDLGVQSQYHALIKGGVRKYDGGYFQIRSPASGGRIDIGSWSAGPISYIPFWTGPSVSVPLETWVHMVLPFRD